MYQLVGSRYRLKAGKELDILTSTAGYTQLIDKPTHFFSGGCSCIDLIFCNKPELISEYGIDHSLFLNMSSQPYLWKD